MIGALVLTTYLFKESKAFIWLLGILSSLIEACLGLPQFYLNFTRKNTEGLAPLLIMMWLFGDVYKLGYYMGYNSPLQLLGCSVF
mmetsp:Transcript_13018/g.21993  ORF Transcript_13018/g.21993 Transcript_13018/m.21993 type:complete len:85 (+) Transcript_13018:693-947(+)